MVFTKGIPTRFACIFIVVAIVTKGLRTALAVVVTLSADMFATHETIIGIPRTACFAIALSTIGATEIEMQVRMFLAYIDVTCFASAFTFRAEGFTAIIAVRQYCALWVAECFSATAALARCDCFHTGDGYSQKHFHMQPGYSQENRPGGANEMGFKRRIALATDG